MWSLYYVRSVVVVVGGSWGASFGMRISQWSSGELVGMKVGVSGFPKCVSDVSIRKSARGLYKEFECGEGGARRSPPRRTGALGCSIVSRMWIQCRVSMYVWFSSLIWCCGRLAAIARISVQALGVSRAIARYGWYVGGM